MLSTANTGIARPTLLMLIARVTPLPTWPNLRPIGMAIRQARPPTPPSATVARPIGRRSVGSRPVIRIEEPPDAVDEGVHLTRPPVATESSGAGYRRGIGLQRCEHHAQDRASQDFWLEVAVLVDEIAQPAMVDQDPHRGQATVDTAAIRSEAKIVGIASGSSTCHSNRCREYPMPTAASRTSR